MSPSDKPGRRIRWGGRVLRVAAVFLLLVVVTDIFLVRYFDRPGLATRTNGRSLSALPYLIDRYENYDGKAVVFLGSSVIAGTSYTTPAEAAPSVTETILRRRTGLDDVRCFNFAVPAFTMGDLYCLFSRLKEKRPGLVVLTINPKFFCREVYQAAPIRLPRMWAVALPEDRARIAGRDGLTFRQKRAAEINETIRRHWALPRLLPLFGERLSGNRNPLGEAMMKNLAEPLSDEIVNPNRPKPFLREPYRWRKLSETKLGYLRTAYAELPPREQNTNFFFLEQLLDLARENKITVLPYIMPLNRRMNDEHKILDTQEYAAFLREVLAAVRARDYGLLNLTDAVDSRWFGDLDHLLYKGHELLAHALADPIAAEVAP